ncbi:MAG: hypothetical protein JEZ12_25775 [Desulfobacterium sp.]|nr:hypothetical protein [Desulfobacterium sp.]
MEKFEPIAGSKGGAEIGTGLRVLVIISLQVVLLVCSSGWLFAQSSWTKDIWWETIDGKESFIGDVDEEYQRRNAPTPRTSDRSLKKMARQKNARILDIVEVDVKCRSKTGSSNKTFYKCWKTVKVKFQKRRDFTLEETAKLRVAESYVEHALPGFGTLEDILKAGTNRLGAILRGTAPADYAKSLKRTISRIKKLNKLLKKIRDPSEALFIDTIDSVRNEVKSSIFESIGNHARLSPEHLKALGYPTTANGMFKEGMKYFNSGNMVLALYWVKIAKKKGYSGGEGKCSA